MAMLFIKSPLHCLRKTGLFKVLLQSILNRPALFEIGFPFRIALRPITHASIYLNRKGKEPQIHRLIRELILSLENYRDKGCFYDVGANIGLYGWLVCSISSTRKTIAFEPDPQNLELLGMTQALAKLENWQVNGIALSDKSGNFSFFQDSITSATGTLCLDDKPWIEKYLGCKTQTIEVKTSTMDEILDSAQWPSLIKIDVEGHELAVLRGGIATLSKYKLLIILESFPPRRSQVVELLSDLGYEFVDADRWQPLEEGTSNLFAWHTAGPLPKSTIKRILKS